MSAPISNAADVAVKQSLTLSLLEHALAYAREGFEVLPLYEAASVGVCTCFDGLKCGRNCGKHPRPSEGLYAATKNEIQIREWWTTWPSANIGIRCGREIAATGSYLYVIDVDTTDDKQGAASLEKLHALIPGGLPETRTHATGSGGIHLFFTTPVALRKAKLNAFPGLDFQGVGSYVVAPPSNHRGGGNYLGSTSPIAPLPDEVVCLLIAEGHGADKNSFEIDPIPLTEASTERRKQAAKDYLDGADLSIEGEHGRDTFFGICVALSRRQRLPNDVIRDLVLEVYNPRLEKAGTTIWDGRDLDERIESARCTSSVEAGDVAPDSWFETVAAIVQGKRTPKNDDSTDHVARTEKRRIGAEDTYAGTRTKPTRSTVVNTLNGLVPAWDGVLWFDVLKRQEMATDAPFEGEKLGLEKGLGFLPSDASRIALWFDLHSFSVSTDAVRDAVNCVTMHHPRNLMVEYFDALARATSSPTLDAFATDFLGATDPFANVLVKKHLIAAARRARNHGAGHRGMLILKGPQGCGKTQALKALAGDWYHTTGNTDLTEDMPLYACVGNLIVEVEELSAIGKKDNDALKTLISRSDDTLNLKFIKDPQPFKRSFVFVGTTNKETFLNDPSGNLRYWVVEVGRIDWQAIEKLRDKIWAEADYLARTGVSNFLDSAEEIKLQERQGKFNRESPFMSKIVSFLADKQPQHVDAQYIWEKCLRADQFSSKTPTQQDQDAIEACLQLLRATKHGRKDGDLARPRVDGRRPSSWWTFTPKQLEELASDNVDQTVDHLDQKVDQRGPIQSILDQSRIPKGRTN